MCVDALLVDDEPLVLMVTAELLTDLGFRVHSARGGAEAIAELKSSRKVDVVVTDVVMPDVSGVDVATIARHRRADMPVLYISGFLPGPLFALIDLSANSEILAKPYTVQALGAAMKRVMASSSYL